MSKRKTIAEIMELKDKSPRDFAKLLCYSYFKNDYGAPLEITDGQADIFLSVFLKLDPRVSIITSTQYGKSTIVACALIARSILFKETWYIIAGTDKIADIIMGNVIQHVFDHKYWTKQLEVNDGQPLDRLRQERSSKRLTWVKGGEINRISAQSSSKKKLKDGLAGQGSPNILEDEACLIPDDFQNMILRMLGGHAVNTLVKVGNAIERNHFHRTSTNEKYLRILIDYKQALAEGRYTPEFVDEIKDESIGDPSFFKNYYECKFPEENEVDVDGYHRLLPDTNVDAMQINDGKHEGVKRLGFDPSEGGDENAGVVRSNKFAEIVHLSLVDDLMKQADIIVQLMKDHGIEAKNVFIDDTGVGAGIVDRLHQLKLPVNGVKWASNERIKVGRANKKADGFKEAEAWVRKGGKAKTDVKWNELKIIKWITNSVGLILMESKERLRKQGIKSPNVADALALTFDNPKPVARVLET